ncbi:MAG: uridine kinase [Bryobacterales bacterium]|nr:uridine kinase [Bryobacterales bacterium]
MPPVLVGVAGASGSGKTVLASWLCRHSEATVISLDHYYRDLGHVPLDARSHANFDHPDSIEWGLAETHLNALARGEAIEQPIYDFRTHTRGCEVRRIAPGRLVVLEGIFALYDDAVRNLMRTRVWVDLDPATCFARRVARDVRERGRTPEEVRHQYERTVQPMYERFVLPTRRFADVIVRGDAPVEEAAGLVLRHAGI